MKYMVNEIHKLENGDINNTTSTYEDMKDAEDAYNKACDNAKNSNIPVHIAVLMSGSGVHIKHESYVHTQ